MHLCTESTEIVQTRTIPVDFLCRCSKPNFLKKLMLLDSVDLRSMMEEDDGAVLTCRFCNEVHEITAPELQGLLDRKAEGGAQNTQGQ